MSYCHKHGRTNCQICIDEIVSLGIQSDKDKISALSDEVERLRGPIRTSEAIDWSLTADEISRQYRAMALDLESAKAQCDELQRRIDEADAQKPVAYRITSDTDCQMRFEYMKSEADFVAAEMGPDSVVTPLYAQPIHALALPPGWVITRVPDAEFQPRDLINICKYKPDGQPERGGDVSQHDDRNLFWHFLNDWLLATEDKRPADLTPLPIDSEGGHCD